jgi:hypothetical protein
MNQPKHATALFVPFRDGKPDQKQMSILIRIKDVEKRGHKQRNGYLFTPDGAQRMCAKLGEYRSNPSAYDEYTHELSFRPHFALCPDNGSFTPHNNIPESREHLAAAYFLRNYYFDDGALIGKAYPGQSGRKQKKYDVYGTVQGREVYVETKVTSDFSAEKTDFLFYELPKHLKKSTKLLSIDVGFERTRERLLRYQAQYSLATVGSIDRKGIAQTVVNILLDESVDLYAKDDGQLRFRGLV